MIDEYLHRDKTKLRAHMLMIAHAHKNHNALGETEQQKPHLFVNLSPQQLHFTALHAPESLIEVELLNV